MILSVTVYFLKYLLTVNVTYSIPTLTTKGASNLPRTHGSPRCTKPKARRLFKDSFARRPTAVSLWPAGNPSAEGLWRFRPQPAGWPQSADRMGFRPQPACWPQSADGMGFRPQPASWPQSGSELHPVPHLGPPFSTATSLIFLFRGRVLAFLLFLPRPRLWRRALPLPLLLLVLLGAACLALLTGWNLFLFLLFLFLWLFGGCRFGTTGRATRVAMAGIPPRRAAVLLLLRRVHSVVPRSAFGVPPPAIARHRPVLVLLHTSFCVHHHLPADWTGAPALLWLAFAFGLPTPLVWQALLWPALLCPALLWPALPGPLVHFTATLSLWFRRNFLHLQGISF